MLDNFLAEPSFSYFIFIFILFPNSLVGQTKPLEGAPEFTTCKLFDFELEMVIYYYFFFFFGLSEDVSSLVCSSFFPSKPYPNRLSSSVPPTSWVTASRLRMLKTRSLVLSS